MVIRVCMEGGDRQNKSAPINNRYKRAFEQLFSTPYFRPKVTMCGSGSEVDAEFGKLVRRAITVGGEVVLALKDSDGKPLDKLREEVIDKLGNEWRDSVDPENNIHFMVQEIEAWFLADKNTVRAEYELVEDYSDARPESISNPKEFLVRVSGGMYSEKFAPNLLGDLDRAVIAAKCPAFKRFADRLAALENG